MESLDEVNAATRAAYNEVALAYHERFHDELDGKPYDRRLLDQFAQRFDETSLVLDAGCGPSLHVGRVLLDKGIAVAGVDISDRCVSLAQELNPGISISQGDMGDLPDSDKSHDGIVAYYSIIDTPRRHVGRLFDEFYRVLKPGGALLTAVKAGDGEGWNEDLIGSGQRVWMTLFTLEEISSHYATAGFEIDFIEARNPFDEEIQIDRVFAVGTKL